MQVNLVYFKPDGGRKDIPLDKPNVVLGRRSTPQEQAYLAEGRFPPASAPADSVFGARA